MTIGVEVKTFFSGADSHNFSERGVVSIEFHEKIALVDR